MKKLGLFIFSLLSIAVLRAQTLEEVVERFITANGGKDRLSAITSLQMQSTLTMERMGMNINITTIREKGKLFRIQSSVPMGGGESFTIVTDTAGYSYMPAMEGPMGSAEASLTKFTADEVAKQGYQMDCAGLFAPLVDYASKGNTASLTGAEKVGEIECDKVTLKLKTGQEMVFFISKNNGQVRRVKVAASTAMEMMGMSGMMKAFGGGGGRNADRKIDIDFEKYKIFDGFPFPTKQTLQLGPMSVLMDNFAFKVNQAIDAKWYKVL
jgi:hypothetical protein